MTVEELLSRISSRELTEWQAYERSYGLLGPRWDQEMAREIHLMLQVINCTIQKVNTEKSKQGQIPEPKLIPGPAEFVVEDVEEE